MLLCWSSESCQFVWRESAAFLKQSHNDCNHFNQQEDKPIWSQPNRWANTCRRRPTSSDRMNKVEKRESVWWYMETSVLEGQTEYSGFTNRNKSVLIKAVWGCSQSRAKRKGEQNKKRADKETERRKRREWWRRRRNALARLPASRMTHSYIFVRPSNKKQTPPRRLGGRGRKKKSRSLQPCFAVLLPW